MKERVTIPPALAAAIARDPDPVRPLLTPARRSLIVGATAAAAGAALIATFGVAGAGGTAATVASVALRLAFGMGLCFVALREAIPADGVSLPARAAAAALGVAGLILLPLLQRESGAAFVPHDSLCYSLVLLTAAPAAALLVWLLGRAYPVRAVSAMALGSLGVAYLADIAATLTCADRSIEHAALVHGGAVLTLTIAGIAIGFGVRRR